MSNNGETEPREGTAQKDRVACLLEVLHDPDPEVRQNAALALGELRDERAIRGLREALMSSDIELRVTALWSLGEIAHPSALPALLIALEGRHWEEREAAAIALGKLGVKDASQAVCALLWDEHWRVRRSAANTLLHLGDPECADELEEACRTEPFSDVRERMFLAMSTLRNLGNPNASSDLSAGISPPAGETGP